MTRRAARVDENHGEIVAEFRRLGCAVQSLAGMGQGVPDLLVCMHGRNELVEVKTEKGKLTPDQVKWFEAWPVTVHVVRDALDVAMLVRWAELMSQGKAK